MIFAKDATLLAIDTSSPACSVALRHQDQIYTQFLADARKHTQQLLPLIDTVLSDAAVTHQQIQGIIISAGPGAFTGLRIGAAVALGLSAAWQVPILPISSLALLAATIARVSGEKNIVAMMDARMNEIYVACFADGKPTSKEYVCAPEALPPEWLENTFVAGSGLVYKNRFPAGSHLDTSRMASEEILPDAQDAFSLPLDDGWLAVGEAIELNYLRNEVTQK